MSIKNHIILNHIDEPIKILFWTKGELCLFFLPFMWGVLSDEFGFGFKHVSTSAPASRCLQGGNDEDIISEREKKR